MDEEKHGKTGLIQLFLIPDQETKDNPDPKVVEKTKTDIKKKNEKIVDNPQYPLCKCGDVCTCGFAEKREDNPERPPKTWWDRMQKQAKRFYPGFGQERINRIVGGIWYNYPENVKYRIWRISEGKKRGSIAE